jgi:hypothetical protein
MYNDTQTDKYKQKENNMNEELHIPIYENGELVQAPAAVRLGQSVLDVLKTATAASLHATGQVLGDMVTSVALDLEDSRSGSHLRAEWCAKRREARLAKMSLLV